MLFHVCGRESNRGRPFCTAGGLAGSDGRGACQAGGCPAALAFGRQRDFGFLDPFAICYPGFLITGDLVDLVFDECPCGRKGYALEGEIRRAPGKEVKGCGGIMASVKA